MLLNALFHSRSTALRNSNCCIMLGDRWYIDPCQVGFLPRHNAFVKPILALCYDGHLVQVVAMMFGTVWNCIRKEKITIQCITRVPVIQACIIGTKVTKVVSEWNEQSCTTLSVHDLAPSILAGRGSRSDATDDKKVCEYVVDDDHHVEGKQED